MCVILALTSVKLHSDKKAFEEVYAIEYIEPEIAEEETKPKKDLAINQVKTHQAYNEAEEFIKKLEQQRAQEDSEFKKKIAALDNAIEEGMMTQENPATPVISKKAVENPVQASEKSNDRNSTNSYRLVNRTATSLPNPVYLCDVGGRIVITIQVDSNGKVTNAKYAASLSNSENECLIDAALSYAQNSTFDAATTPTQMGTITYNFQDQD